MLAGPVLVATFVLAFCSIVYELLLGQALSAFLGNTVLRYSVTIGLYMFSMGIGALLAGKRLLEQPLMTLQVVEISLTLLGTLSLPLLLTIDVGVGSMATLAVVAHLLIVLIGVLTGLEIPLLIEIIDGGDESPGQVLGIDYVGAFAGTVAFALWFYPWIGVVATAFIVALLNAITGLCLPLLARGAGRRHRFGRPIVFFQGLLAILIVASLWFYPKIEEFGIGLYIAD